MQRFNDVLSLSVKPVRVSTAQVALKRLFAVCPATLGLLVTLPFMAVVAMAVRLSSPGPILYRQERVTRNGRVFVMSKFRTMREGENSEDRVVDLDVPTSNWPTSRD